MFRIFRFNLVFLLEKFFNFWYNYNVNEHQKCVSPVDCWGYTAYFLLDANKDSIIAQNEIITELANKEAFVIVSRCADYILRNHKNLVTIFLYAD